MYELLRILHGQYQPTQLSVRVGFSSPTQASFFLVYMGDSMGMGFHLCVMPRLDPLFQKVMKNLFGLKSSKNTFEQGYPGGLFTYGSSEAPFPKISAPFISVNITIIFYSFLLMWITFLPWQIIMQMLKLFTINGYYMISHWKRIPMCSSVHLFWTFW